MDHKKAQELLDKYLKGECTDEENLLIESWYNKLTDDAEEQLPEIDWNVCKNSIRSKLPSQIAKKKLSWYQYAAAAFIAISLGLGLIFFLNRPEGSMYANDVAPGGKKAVLTLAGGKRVILSNAPLGLVAEESGVFIKKTDEGELNYVADEKAANGQSQNMIETPAGGEYKVKLPDGTLVWLNAASTLSFPVSFRGKERKVSLSGEAYFEVSHDALKPFLVESGQQQVRVLGTHFNIKAYASEHTILTTLLEGRVSLNNDVYLNPGQQSEFTRGNRVIRVAEADLESVMAWKNNDFVFKNETVAEIMTQLERWYDVEVIYEKDAPMNVTLGGWVSRKKNISAVLRIMELTGKVHFKIEGRRITVMP